MAGDERAARPKDLRSVRTASGLGTHDGGMLAATFAALALSASHVHVLGRSVRGRAIRAFEVGDPASPRKLLIVGCIHGNEPAGIAIAQALARAPAVPGADLWIVPDLNPDGVAA